MMMDKTIRKSHLARITVDTPFYKGDIHVLCSPDSIYDLIILNTPLARPADKPDPMWTVASCKAQTEKNYYNKEEDYKKEGSKKWDITETDDDIKKKHNLCKIDKPTFIQMQQNDETLRQAKGKNV